MTEDVLPEGGHPGGGLPPHSRPTSSDSPLRDAATRQTLRPLLLGNIMQALGIQIFAPILPIYLAKNDISSGLIGLTMAAGIAGYGSTQYPSGRIADRFDRRLVLLSGMLLYSLAFYVYLLPLPGPAIPVVRFLHAGLAGLYTVSAVAVLADVTPIEHRGRMYGTWHASTRTGFLIGPLLGGIIASVNLEFAFIFSGASCLIACAVMTRLPHSRPQRYAVAEKPSTVKAPGLLRRILPLILIGAGCDYASGTFMAIWSLWMISNGATTLAVGLAFCLFALPAVLLSTWLGTAADRYGPRRILFLSYLGLAVLGPLCALAHGTVVLSTVALLAGLFTTAARPIVSADASRLVTPAFQARAQSVLFTGLMAAQLIAAIAAGLLLGLSPLLAFTTISIVSVISLSVSLTRYRPGDAAGWAGGGS